MSLAPEVRTRLLAAIHRRATSLVRITKPGLNAPDAVLAFIGMSVINTLLALLGEALHKTWLEKLWGSVLEDNGVCKFCQTNEKDVDMPMCQVCWDAMEKDEDEAMIDELMDGEPRGGIS